MWDHMQAIAWAQFRTSRNHLPRTSIGSLLLWLLTLLWYGLFVGLGLGLAMALPRVPLPELREAVPAALLAIFVFWQFIPLLTLSTGWSLQLNKLRVYPVSDPALFWIEVILRITTAPEMIPVVIGGMLGLMRNPRVPALAPLWLLLYIPLNLLLSLGIREFILRAFSRNRFRELFAILIISIAVVPQFLVRSSLGQRSLPYVLRIARWPLSPWQPIAKLTLAEISALAPIVIVTWLAGSYLFARRQFDKALSASDDFRASGSLFRIPTDYETAARPSFSLAALAGQWLPDPLGALVQKELRSLLRMPRFRVIFGMACVLGSVVFIPMALDTHLSTRTGFLRDNFLSVIILYGLLLMSDALLLNVFGLDRSAAQLYYIAPVPLKTVIRAKNVTALVFISIQCAAVFLVAAVLRVSFTVTNLVNAVAGAAVVAVFLLCVGNMLSVRLARPIDPTETFKKQAGGKMQLYLMLCAIGMFLLIGLAFLARYALNANWALLAVLGFEFLIGMVTYGIASESAVQSAMRNRERMLEALSRGSTPIGLGLL